MKFSYNWLQDYISGKLPNANKLAELLMFHSFEVESVEKVGKDWVMDIKVLPNRAGDCFSHFGIAREICALLNVKCKILNVKFKEEKNKKPKDFVVVEVQSQEDCSRYTATIIEGVKVGQSPKWMQERLQACGLQAINNIVDATNYVMIETGQPLHAFDAEKIGNKKIIIRRAKKGEVIETLDKEKTAYQLNENILVIADEKKPIAIAGIKGGKETGIDEQTKTIIIEAANFNRALIRRGSQQLKLRTDASARFENGIDLNLIDLAQARVCGLIKEIAGGKVLSGMAEVSAKKPLPIKIKLDLHYVNQLLGVVISVAQIKKIFQTLDLPVKSLGQNFLMVEIPTRRLDLKIQEDLIEEIGRVYGYEKIISVMPMSGLSYPKTSFNLMANKMAKNTLKELGFCEAYNYSFVAGDEQQIFGFNKDEMLGIENPASSAFNYLRASLLPGILQNIKENFKNFSEVKIFEAGKIFGKNLEKEMLSGVVARKQGGDEAFYELKGVVEILLNRFGLDEIWFDNAKATPENSKMVMWHPGKTAEIKAGDLEIGFLGEINPQVCHDLGIEGKVFAFDLDGEKLLKLAKEDKEYKAIQFYPASLRDIALTAIQGTKIGEIQNIIERVGGELLVNVDLFDVYSGKELGEDKESFAFHLVFQAQDRTLSAKEVDEVFQKIVKALDEQGYSVRK